jgi:peptidoglycan hydrolase-like protein with peptidoglycan-binding domain
MAQVAFCGTGESTKNGLTGKVFNRQKILDLPNLQQGEQHEYLGEVQDYLKHYGYLPKDEHSCTKNTLDEPTCGAVKKFQQFFKLEETGKLDTATKEHITASRCGFPDLVNSVDFQVAGPWAYRNLKYTFGILSRRVPAEASRNAIRRAFDTWTNVGVGLTFTEVAANQNPDIFIEWRQANDPDHNMVGGVLAHADFPPGFSIISNGLPLPLHYDDQEHPWVDGAVPGGYDIETVGLHELGHCLGLYHSNVLGAIMYPSVGNNITKRRLTPDDKSAIQNLYPKVPRVNSDSTDDRSL